MSFIRCQIVCAKSSHTVFSTVRLISLDKVQRQPMPFVFIHLFSSVLSVRFRNIKKRQEKSIRLSANRSTALRSQTLTQTHSNNSFLLFYFLFMCSLRNRQRSLFHCFSFVCLLFFSILSTCWLLSSIFQRPFWRIAKTEEHKTQTTQRMATRNTKNSNDLI